MEPLPSVTILAVTLNTQIATGPPGSAGFESLKLRADRALNLLRGALEADHLMEVSNGGRVVGSAINNVGYERANRNHTFHLHFTWRIESTQPNIVRNGFSARVQAWWNDVFGGPGCYFHSVIMRHASAASTYALRKQHGPGDSPVILVPQQNE